MKIGIVKYGAMAALLSMFLIGCTSTDTAGTTGAGAGSAIGADTMSNDSIATGTVDTGSISGSSLDADSGVARVFYFEFDKAILNSDARGALRLHAQSLKANPINIRLEGHTDERGTREYNMALGERRANSVRDFLVQEGVNNAQIEVISYGEESPAAFGSSEESYGLNRRVEMK